MGYECTESTSTFHEKHKIVPTFKKKYMNKRNTSVIFVILKGMKKKTKAYRVLLECTDC